MAMFCFIKCLSVFRIVAEPCADHILLLGGFAIAQHHAPDVGAFGGRKDKLVPLPPKKKQPESCFIAEREGFEPPEV